MGPIELKKKIGLLTICDEISLHLYDAIRVKMLKVP